MIRPPPISTLFPYTTLFRSPPTATKEIQYLNAKGALTYTDIAGDPVLYGNLQYRYKRSEERFSRNAETDLVCRLLLEKKKNSHTLNTTIITSDAIARLTSCS